MFVLIYLFTCQIRSWNARGISCRINAFAIPLLAHIIQHDRLPKNVCHKLEMDCQAILRRMSISLELDHVVKAEREFIYPMSKKTAMFID